MDYVNDKNRLEVLRRTNLLDSAPEEAFDRVVRLTARLLGAPVALMSLVDETRQFFKSAVGVEEKPWAESRQTPLSQSLCRQVVRDGRRLIVEDAARDGRASLEQIAADLEISAYAGVPLVLQGERIGALCAISDAPRTWGEDELKLLDELACLIITELDLRLAVAESLRLERLAQERAQLLDAVFDATPEVIVAVSSQGTILRANAAARRLYGTAKQLQRPPHWEAHHGIFQLDGETPLMLDQLPISRALRGEELRHMDLVVRSPEHVSARIMRVNATPLRHPNGEVWGAITASHDVTDIEHAHAEFRRTTQKDELTGLLNRQAFTELATHQLDLLGRHDRTALLFFVDMNGFKAINDTLGHQAGDMALKHFALALQETFRGADLLARFGGDEFVVLALEASSEHEEAFRKRLERNLSEHNAKRPEREHLRASIGVAEFAQPSRPSLQALLSAADTRMYKEKERTKALSSKPPA